MNINPDDLEALKDMALALSDDAKHAERTLMMFKSIYSMGFLECDRRATNNKLIIEKLKDPSHG